MPLRSPKFKRQKFNLTLPISYATDNRAVIRFFDIPATLDATVKKGGFPSVQYRYSSRPTDYLVLIDLQSADSHLARLFQYLATMLQDQDVLLDIFYYQNDFNNCWNYRHSNGINLEQLHRLYPTQRLIVMGKCACFSGTNRSRTSTAFPFGNDNCENGRIVYC